MQLHGVPLLIWCRRYSHPTLHLVKALFHFCLTTLLSRCRLGLGEVSTYIHYKLWELAMWKKSPISNSRRNSLCLEPLENRLMLSTVPPTVSDVNVSGSQWTGPFIDYLETSGLGNDGYSIPVGSSAQLTSLPWTNLDRISITFSEDVNVDFNDLSISGVTNTTYDVDHFFYDPQTRVATWTLDTPIAAGERIHLDLDGDGVDPVEDLDGNTLDGEWTDEVSTYTSGNGTAGGDFEFSFNVLEGDAVASNLVDYFDYIYTRLAEGLGTEDPGYSHFYDIDGSGAIEQADWQEVLNHLWATLPTGTPPGAINDAPTTIGFDLVAITDRVADTTVSLHDAFDDAEDPDSALTYSIRSQTNANLFDNVSINPANGVLTLNAAATGSGRSRIVIVATDTSGLSVQSTVTADVDYVNQPPVISNYLGVDLGSGVWQITGVVSDPDNDVEGWIVELGGVFETRVVVQADGTFSYTTILDPNDWGTEYATTSDPYDAPSNIVGVFIGLT